MKNTSDTSYWGYVYNNWDSIVKTDELIMKGFDINYINKTTQCYLSAEFWINILNLRKDYFKDTDELLYNINLNSDRKWEDIYQVIRIRNNSKKYSGTDWSKRERTIEIQNSRTGETLIVNYEDIYLLWLIF